MRGEKSGPGSSPLPMRGSPPRARGEAHPVLYYAATPRITPACAGRSRGYQGDEGRRWDHPRVRGEKHHLFHRGQNRLGSPPRARGEDKVKHRRIRLGGITPACAGRSRAWHKEHGKDTDHPRVRGEKTRFPLLPFPLPGSPPRARGEVAYVAENERVARITPACAGRSQTGAGNLRSARDHPRVRGEKPSTAFA